MPNADELRAFIQKKFSEHLGLSPEEIFGADLTLAALITRSERLHNSVDLMEAFARCSNALRREYGLRVRLPALALDTRISKVLEAFLQEVERQREGRAA